MWFEFLFNLRMRHVMSDYRNYGGEVCEAPKPASGIRQVIERLASLQSEAADVAAMIQKTFSSVTLTRTTAQCDQAADKVRACRSDLAEELDTRCSALSASLAAIRDVALASDL